MVIRGLPGSGKSTVAKIIASKLGNVGIVDQDEVDVKSDEFLELRRSVTGEIPDRTVIYRFDLRNAKQYLTENKMVIWPQPWTKVWGIEKAVRSLKSEFPDLEVNVVQFDLPPEHANERVMQRAASGGHTFNEKSMQDFILANEEWQNNLGFEIPYFHLTPIDNPEDLADQIITFLKRQ